MTDADLQQFGGDITPMEMYDALCGIRTVMTKEEVPEVPNAMKALNCLIQVVKQEFDLDEQLKDRYGVNGRNNYVNT